MKISFFTIIAALFLFSSCASTVSVRTDYDTRANFNAYKSFAFYKPSVDELEISDLDKKRILRAVEAAMIRKGFVKSENPDLLVGLTTKAQRSVRTYGNNFGYGYGFGYGGFRYGGAYWNRGGFVNTYETIEGTLYLDLIDANKKELIWQGIGQAPLVQGPEAKEERINEIVTSILAKYPPNAK